MKDTRCIKCEVLENRSGYTIAREEDQKIDMLTLEPKGRTYVFYTVNDEEMILGSFKTVKEARRYADEL